MFTASYAAMVASTWMRFIPTDAVRLLAGMWVASFALTTLDTTNRLGRYCLTELLLPLKERSAPAFRVLTNRWVASLIPAAIGIWLAWSDHFSVLWPSFGTANQLIASISLLTAAAWVAKRMQARATLVIVPAVFLWITVTAAMIWFCAVVLPDTIRTNPATGIAVLVIEAVMFALNIFFMVDFLRVRRTEARAGG
jgi:carbon starvation protein